MEIRSFLAFELPKEILETVAKVSRQMRDSPLEVRWVMPNRIHLTIIFLGSISRENLDLLEDPISRVCQNFRPFRAAIRGVGTFGSQSYPRVLWLRLDGETKRMGLFRDALARGLKPFGIKSENRPFSPHLTLGRFRKGARAGAHLQAVLQGNQDLISPPGTFGELALFKSDLKPGGAVYTKINGWPLSGVQ